MAFCYAPTTELALLSPNRTHNVAENPVEVEAELLNIHSLGQLPRNEAPRPNRLSRALRLTQLAVQKIIHRPRRSSLPRDKHLSLTDMDLLLRHLDLRGAARKDKQYPSDRPPRMSCPYAAQDLHERLVISRSVGRRSVSRVLFGGYKAPRPAWYVTYQELPSLLEPVLAEMRASLSYVEVFRGRLSAGGGCDDWLDLPFLRMSVFKLMGFWPHDIMNDLEAWGFGLPDDLTRLLYPQCGRFDHGEMACNLDEIVLGPGWDAVRDLETLVRLCRPHHP